MSSNNSSAVPLSVPSTAAGSLKTTSQQQKPSKAAIPPLPENVAAAAAAAANKNNKMNSSNNTIPLPPPIPISAVSSSKAAAGPSLPGVKLSSTAYYDNLKTCLLATTSTTRHEAFGILTDFVNTHPLVVAITQQQQNDAKHNQSNEKSKPSISAAEYSSFLNAMLPVFQNLLLSPASDTSLALVAMGTKKGGGTGASKKKKKKKATAAAAAAATAEKDGKGKKKKGGAETKGGKSSNTASGDVKKTDATSSSAPAPAVPPPPLDGKDAPASSTATTTTATAAAKEKTKTKKSTNSTTTKKSGATSNKTPATAPPAVPSYFIPPSSSSSSIEHQIRHLILTTIIKFPSSNTSTPATTTTTSNNVAKTSTAAKGTTTTALTMRSNHIHSILTMAIHTLLEDYEPNALLAIQLLRKWHLHLGNIATSTTTSGGNTKENSKLMKECQIFFDFIVGTSKDMGKKGANGGEAWLNHLFGGSSGTVVDSSTLKSKHSLQVLAEVPSIVKLIFQFHSKLYKTNAVSVIPALIEGLKLTAPAFNVANAAPGSSSAKSLPTPPSATDANIPPSLLSPTRTTLVPDPTQSATDDSQSVTSSSTSPSLFSMSSSSNPQLSPQQLQKRAYHKRLNHFLTMQIRILSYLTCLLRKAFVTKPQPKVDRKYGGFHCSELNLNKPNTHDPLPWASAATVTTLLRPHEEVLASIILQLLRNCPREDVTTRKELLLSARLILSISEFRDGFFRHVDNMLDERILVGCTTSHIRGGSSSNVNPCAGTTLELQSVVRPLGYTVLAEFLTLVRAKLTPAQLSRVVRIFSRLLHDTRSDVPISLQIMTVRLLLSLCEPAYHSKDPNVQVGRDLLVRILMTVVQKFRTLKDKIPVIMENAKREIELKVKSLEMEGGYNDDVLFRVVVTDATFDGDYHGDPLFILRDVQSLLQPMILRMRNLFYYISTYSHHMEKELRKSNAAGEERYPLPTFVTNRENEEVSSATLKLTQGEREIIADFLMSGISCLKVFRMDVDPDEDPSRMELYDESKPSPKFREICDMFAVIFTGMDSHNFARVIEPNLPKILEEFDKDGALLGIFSSMLLDSRGLGKSHSYDLCAVLVPYILDNFVVLGEYEELQSEKGGTTGNDQKVATLPVRQLTIRANNLFKIFNLAFSSLMKHPKNEAVFLPHLQKITSECLKGATRGPYLVPNPYSNILRSLFRTISAGKFSESYKELLPLVATILNELYRMYAATNVESFRLIIIELCLTLPTRLSVLLPHLPLLLKLVITALQSKEGDLVNLGLRTLEFWVDNLHPDYLFPIFAQQSSTLCGLMLALTHHLQPAPYPYGLLCLRLIGKLGGKNRLFLREILAQNRKAKEFIAANQLSLQCEWLCQPSPESKEKSDEMETKDSVSSFLLPLPLERAVEILRLVSVSPKIVKKTSKSDIPSTASFDRHCSDLLFQDSRDLDINSLSEDLMESAKKEQSEAAFAVIRGALASILDVDSEDSLNIRLNRTCSNQEEKIEPLLNASDETISGDDIGINTNAFKQICDGLFAATAHDDLHEEAIGMLKGVAAHVFLVLSSNEKDVVRIDGDGFNTDPFVSPDEYEASDHIDGKIKTLKPFGCFRISQATESDINPLEFNISLVDAFSSGSTTAAKEVMYFVIDMFRQINRKIEEKESIDSEDCEVAGDVVDLCANGKEVKNDQNGDVSMGDGTQKIDVEESKVNSSPTAGATASLTAGSVGQIMFEHLLSEFSLACFSKEWMDRTGVMDGLIFLMREMGITWCKHFEVALLHTAMFVVKDAPSHIANACKYSIFFFARVTSFFYGSPASWQSSLAVRDILSSGGGIQNQSLTDNPVSVCKASLTLVVAEIASTNALVRFAVRHFLRVVSNDYKSLGQLLSDHIISLKRLLFAKLLRTLSLPDLVAVVDAVAFINEAVPNLIPIDDANMISILGELIKMVSVADGEISDKNFGSVVLIDKNGWAVDSEGEPISDRKPLVQPSSIFQRHAIILEDDGIGARIVVPEGLSLGVHLRVSTLYLFRAIVRLDDFIEAENQSQMGNLRPHIVSLLFRSLTSEPPLAVETSTSALKIVLKFCDGHGGEDANDTSQQHTLSKELIQACIRPILVHFRDHKQLTVPLLEGLLKLLTLLSSWFNKSLGDKMLDHLQHFLDPEKIIALKVWRAGEEPLVAAAIMNLFSALPDASNFVEALVKTSIRLESVLSAYGAKSLSSPFREPLARYLNRHCAGTVGFFLEEHRLSNPMYNDLFFDILKRDDSHPLRQYLGGKECTVMLLNVCFDRPLAIVRAEKQSPASKADSSHLNTYGINQWYSPTAQRKLEIARQAIEMKKKILGAKQQEEAKSKKSLQNKGGDKKSTEYQTALKAYQSVRDACERAKKEVEDTKNSYARQISTSFQQDSKQRTMTVSSLELQTQGFRLVEVLKNFDRQYLSQHDDIVRAMRWLWRSRGRHYRLLHEEEMPPRYHNESLLLSRFLVSYSRSCPDDTDVLFDLIRIFLQPFSSIDFSFVKHFLADTMVNVLTSDQKSQVINRFLTLLAGDGSEETKVLSCQMLIMPTLKQGNPKAALSDSSVRQLVKLLLNHGGSFGSKLTCELLNMVIILLDQMHEGVAGYRKDILKYIWGVLKADNLNTKYVGYLAASKFVAVFESPPKVILQAYRSLLRSHSISADSRNVREAMNLLLPNLRLRLGESDLESVVEYTINFLNEVGDSMKRLINVWDVIIRHNQAFERFKVRIIPHLKHAVSLIGSHLNSQPQCRLLSVKLAKLMIDWADGGDPKSLTQNISDALVNILVRIVLLNAESEPKHADYYVTSQSLSLLGSITSCRKTCNIEQNHFRETTLVLLSLKSTDQIDAKDKNGTSSDDKARGEERKQSILSVCIAICTILQRNDPTNEFLESYFCKILKIYFSMMKSVDDSRLIKMMENLVARILTDGRASAELISNVTILVDNTIVEASHQMEETNGGFLAVSIVEKVAQSNRTIAEPFMSSLYMLMEVGVKNHVKESEENMDTASLTKQGKFHQHSSTPTSGILGTALGLHFKEVGSSKDMHVNDGDPRNQIVLQSGNLSSVLKALVTCIMLIGSSERVCDEFFGKGFVEVLLALLNASNSFHMLATVVSIAGKLLLSGDRFALKKSACNALLIGLVQFDYEMLPEVEARYLSDQISCFVLKAYGYDQSVIERYPFGFEKNESMSDNHVSAPNGNLVGEEAFQELFMSCLLSANQHMRTLCIATYSMMSSDAISVHEKLSMKAIEIGCRSNDSLDIAGVPTRELKDVLLQIFGSDFECIGGKLWTIVLLDIILAMSNHRGGVRGKVLESTEVEEDRGPATFMPLKSYDDDCSQENVFELRYADFDDGVYTSFVKVILAERSEKLCGKGRCISAVRKILHGDPKSFQPILEHCMQAAWQRLPSKAARVSLISPLEALLAKPYHSQFTDKHNFPHLNAVQSMLRLLVKLRPIPVLDSFLLQSIASDYNAIYEVLTYFECQYEALRRNEIDADSSSYTLIMAIRHCYDALGERDICNSISSAISSAQTKFALSLDTYGFVNESVDAFGKLIENAGNDVSLLPTEGELQIWEDRWVESHKEMSQWALIDEFATSQGEAQLSLEAAWKTKNWEKLKSLFAAPSVVALLEEGDQCAKMTEMYLEIQKGNLDAVDDIHAQIAQLCLYRWQLLPSISSGSQAHQSLLQQCTRLVELRESSQLLLETQAHVSKQTVPDLKTLLTAWKHRSPNLFEPISEWEDLFLWRSTVFDSITTNFEWVEAGKLATLHDRPHCCISLSRAARKQALKEVATFSIGCLGDSIMDVDSAFLKWREEVTTYQFSSENELKGGLNLVNSADVSYFSDRQKAEVFRLKAYFLNELRDKAKANQAYCQAVQICPNHSRAWQDWGDLCVSLSDATRKKLADDNADKKDLAKKASQYLSQAAGCYLEALRVDTSEQSRDRIPQCLSMLAADGRQYGSICRTLQARGATTSAWCWLPWIPQLLSSLCRVEAPAVKPILINILKDHPQALYYSLRSFFLERRDVEKSVPDHKSDAAEKDEGEIQSSLKLAEIIMSSLRKVHPVLWNRLELILDNLIVRFRPSYEAELLQTFVALLNRTAKVEEKMEAKDGENADERRIEYYQKALSRIGEKFFTKSASLSKKARIFQSRYGSSFDSDFSQSNLGSFEEFVEKLQKWKLLLERQVSRVPAQCKLSESSPALSWFSAQAPDMWAGACCSKSLSASNAHQDSLSSPHFYDSIRSSALKAARASSYAVLLAARSEGIDGYSGGGAAAIEIPGQYSPTFAGIIDSRPIPELHAKLVQFKQILEVTSTSATKQHVHKITMIGSDGREYKFLLQLAAPYSTRTDERSAQIQFIMGKTLRRDIRTCRRGLVVRPNVVIPLAQRMRMSATEDSHQSLESIYSCVRRDNIDVPAYFQKMVDERISQSDGADSDAKLAAEKNARLEVYTEICQQHMSSNHLSKFMMQIISSTESLCQFRKEFTSQLAANSVLQYVFAVVERTPSRFVLCHKTGQILAYDFRSYYNHGLLENQPVPFRMTRNISEFIGPFLMDGVFVPSFVSICGAMSSRRNVLEPMLHLLLRDDVISWYTSKTSAANDKKIQDIELQLSDRVWKNVRFVQQRFDSCAPECVENVAEAIEDNAPPIDMKVRALVDAACSADNLSSMPTSYQAWL